MRSRVLATIALLTVLFVLMPGATIKAQDNVGDLCATPGNLILNCRFNDGFRGQTGMGSVAKNFFGYIISGHPDFNSLCDSPEPPCQRIWSDGGLWEAGIYQPVSNITLNQGYRARIGWFTPQCDNPSNVGRIGIDPTGGSDPNSPDIIWNNWIRLQKSNSYGIHQVKAVARNSTITVFITARFQSQCSRGNTIWLDAVILVADGSAPPPAAPTAVPPTDTPRPAPTNTRIPPTRTATRPPATNTPLPTDTPTAMPTVADTATPTPSPTETATSSPTATRRPTNTPTPATQAPLNVLDAPGVDVIGLSLVGASGCSLLLAVGLGGFAIWFWRRR